MLESTLQSKFIRKVKELNLGIAVKVDSSSRRGWPDLVYVDWNGFVSLIEMKADHGKLSEHQKDLHGELLDLGCEVVTITGYGRLNKFIDQLVAEYTAQHPAKA